MKRSTRMRAWAQAFAARDRVAHAIAWERLTEDERLSLEAAVRTRGELMTLAEEVLKENGNG